MLLNDERIRALCTKSADNEPMITPFCEQTRLDNEGNKIISYGLSSYGYDIRIQNQFKVFTNALANRSVVVDPKKPEECFVDVVAPECIIPPNSFVLAVSFEYMRIPRDVLAVCVGKSTYARCGLIVNVTPLEPEWEGYITIEISNTTNLPAKVYAGEGIAQLLFHENLNGCATSYKDKKGKYQKQEGITLPRM